MSSPKRAAKSVAKIATKSAPKGALKSALKNTGKTARRASDSRPATKPAVAVVEGASAEAKRLAAVLERSVADGKLGLVSAEALQKLLAAACRVYTARSEAGEQFMPVPRNSLTATDVMVTASGLLRAANLAVFELGMWQSWTGR